MSSDILTKEALEALEETAKLANGNWRHNTNNTVSDEQGWVVAQCEGAPTTARYIATFDGPTVQALIATAKLAYDSEA